MIIFVLCGSYMPISGFQGILAGFVVGIKQIIPDQELSLLRIKAKVWTFTIGLITSRLALKYHLMICFASWEDASLHSHWCCFKFHAVVSISYALDSYCYKLLYRRVCSISSNLNIWHIYELDLLEILSEETRNKTKGWSKWWFCILILLPRILQVFSPFLAGHWFFSPWNAWVCLRSSISLSLSASRPIIDPIASIFHRMLCGRFETSIEAHGYTLGGAPLPGSDPIEASRRR